MSKQAILFQHQRYSEMAELYLLHFKEPYWKNCRHYLGITKFTAEERCAVHRGTKKNGSKPSKLVQYALAHGNDFVIAHVEQFDEDWEARKREKLLKRGGHLPKLCPICQGRVNRFDELPKVVTKPGIQYQDRSCVLP